eukprot:12937359-Prorocentrum_lima.AAC.1
MSEPHYKGDHSGRDQVTRYQDGLPTYSENMVPYMQRTYRSGDGKDMRVLWEVSTSVDDARE